MLNSQGVALITIPGSHSLKERRAEEAVNEEG